MGHKTHNICRGPVSNSGCLGHRETVGSDIGKVNKGQIMKCLICCAKGFGFYPTGYREPLKAFRQKVKN